MESSTRSRPAGARARTPLVAAGASRCGSSPSGTPSCRVLATSWRRPSPRAAATSSPSRPRPSSGSTRSCRGRRLGASSRGKWQSTARTAAKQARRATVPHVAPAATTAQLTQRVGESALALVLHEDADLTLGRVELPAHGEVVLVVGPEGGIDRSELQTLTAAGAVAVRLGTEVLRASTAGPAALAVLCSRTRWDAL